jgi:hypothetical protein
MSFNLPEFFLRLQWLQDQHDKHYHQDIYTMSRTNNITHMVMHMAKYTGKMVDISMGRERLEFPTDPNPQYAAVLTDYLIVLMSSANRMNINLGIGLAPLCKTANCWATVGGFYPIMEIAVEALRETVVLDAQVRDKPLLEQLVPFIQGMGKMSKALEALDHMESYPSREVLNDHIVLMFQHALRLYHYYSPRAFTEAIKERMVQIERASFMYHRRPKYSEGFIPTEV